MRDRLESTAKELEALKKDLDNKHQLLTQKDQAFAGGY